MITVLAGGVGAARFLTGLVQVVEPKDIVAIVNTGDDFVLHGLSISPDIDTIRYTLAGDIGEHGWGRSNETWHAMAEMGRLATQAPNGSRASDWFGLGDRDIATHLYRSQRMCEGATLTEVTGELTRAASLDLQLLPMSNDRVATMITLVSGETIDFQEYFVARKHLDPVASVQYVGAEDATAGPGVCEAIEAADRIVIAPSNPVLSIGPIVAVEECAHALRSARHKTVAISPLIGGRAIKGPADHLLGELGHQPTVAGIADLLSPYAHLLVADSSDESSDEAVIDVAYRPTLMASSAQAQQLARDVMTIDLG